MTHIGSLTATSFASLKKKQLEQDLELIAELWDLEGLLRHHSSDVKNRVGQFVKSVQSVTNNTTVSRLLSMNKAAV